MLDIGIGKGTVELPFIVERTCTDCANDSNDQRRETASTSSISKSASASVSCWKLEKPTASRCHPHAAKLNRKICLCEYNRMATSCIYFVLVLAILCVRNTSAAFHNNITNNNHNNTYDNNDIEGASKTHNSAGILKINEIATEFSPTSKSNSKNYSNYQHKYRKAQQSGNSKGKDPTLIAETDSEASNTHNNNSKINNKNNIGNSSSSASAGKNAKETEKHHLDDIDIFGAYSIPDDPIYTNEFAVHIPAGKSVADIIASKHGFTNKGQVRKHYYIFQDTVN